MKHFSKLFATASALLFAISATVSATAKPSIVPQPSSIEELRSEPFTLNDQTKIFYRGKGAQNVAKLLAEGLRSQTQLPFAVSPLKGEKPKNAIILSVSSHGKNKNPEAYTLVSGKNQVKVQAPSSRGLFNASQTILQLVPLGKKFIPSVRISDAPTYKWRGMMLDVARYFFTKE